MIKTIVIWLVKILKLEEVFIAEAKKEVKEKVIQKIETVLKADWIYTVPAVSKKFDELKDEIRKI
jgi:hypothetical protein